MSEQQLIDEVVGYLTKDGAVMGLARARQGAKLIRRQHARIEADEALMRTMLDDLHHIKSMAGNPEAVWHKANAAITALRSRLETK